jgi:hypothetical protein
MRTATLCMVAFGLTTAGRLAAQRDDPPTSINVRAELQESEGGNGDRQVYVINGSSHSIVVTSVRLTDCENIQNCGTNRVKMTLGPGGRIMVLRVRLRFPDRSSSFRYTFTWEPEREEGPTAADVAKDPRALVIDTVVVMPKFVDLKVGETVNLSQVLSIKAMNAKGARFPRSSFEPPWSLAMTSSRWTDRTSPESGLEPPRSWSRPASPRSIKAHRRGRPKFSFR